MGRTTWLLLILAVACSSQPGPERDQGNVSVGSCVEAYGLDALAKRSLAFDGTITAIQNASDPVDPDRVTFRVNTWFKGGSEPEITLKAVGFGSVTSAGTLSGGVGDRMLVAGDDGWMWSCGFSQPYNDRVAADWKAKLE